MTTDQGPYPVQFAVEYPDRPLNRLTSFFRIFVIIPICSVIQNPVFRDSLTYSGTSEKILRHAAAGN
jgi:hypothetical protein